MVLKKCQVLPLLLLCVGIALLIGVRAQSAYKQDNQVRRTWASSFSPTAEIIAAGPLRGMMADFRMLDVFALYYEASQKRDSQALQYLPVYLNRAQNLDPKFFDVYRLAGSILAYDAHMPEASVALLRKSFEQRPDAWEFPFFAGFIAHDLLHDDKLAFDLISVAVGRKGTPPFLATLASRFLQSTATTQDAIAFLQGIIKVMPPEYQAGVKLRIQELSQNLAQ